MKNKIVVVKNGYNFEKALKRVHARDQKKLDNIDKVIELCLDGIRTDGAHHKQWYLCEILKLMDKQQYNKNKDDFGFNCPG